MLACFQRSDACTNSFSRYREPTASFRPNWYANGMVKAVLPTTNGPARRTVSHPPSRVQLTHPRKCSPVSSRIFSLTAGEQDVLAHAKVSAELALGELIWNALDADAKEVSIELERNVPGGPVVRLTVTDDGNGMGPQEIDSAFAAHRMSMKRDRRISPGGRPMHGHNGRGRFRTFAVATSSRWRTWGEDLLGDIALTEVALRSDRPTDGEVREMGEAPPDQPSRTGTVVTLHLADTQKAAHIGDPQFNQRLEAVLASTLVSLTDAAVSFDGTALDPSAQIEHQAHPEFEADLADYDKFDGSGAGTPVLHVIEWKTSVIKPTLFLCDDSGAALVEFEGQRLPKAPGINWSAYLRWEGFGRTSVNEGDLQNARAAFVGVIEPALASLARYLRDRSDELTGDLIATWVTDGTYPYLDQPETILDETEQAGFRELVAVARKVVPTDREQRRLTLGMMQATFKESPDDAIQVIARIKGLDPSEVQEFRELLDRTPLSRVIRASKMLTDRIDFLLALDELLHGVEHRDLFLERDQLHRLVEKNPWIFGNEWSLVRSEASLVSALREHLKILRPDDPEEVDPAEVDRGKRRVDMLFAGATNEHRRTRRLVVELKRASITLGRRERDQIESYAQSVAGHAKFQGEVVHWDFWLLGTKIGDDIRPSVRVKNEPAGRFQEVQLDNGSTYSIWVLSWSDVISNAKHSHEFFREEIAYDPDVAEALRGIRERYPDHVPAV